MVSHDRWLIENLNCRIMFLDDGTARFFDDYAEFRNYTQASRTVIPEEKEPKTQKKREETLSAKENRRQKAEYRQRRSFLEKRIEELETEEKQIEEELKDPQIASDAKALNDLCIRLDEVKNEVLELTDEYLENYAD